MFAPSTPSRSPTCAQSARWQRSWRDASIRLLMLSQPVASTAQAVTRNSRTASASDRLRTAGESLGVARLVRGIVVHVAADIRVPVAEQSLVAGGRTVALAYVGPVRPLAAVLAGRIDLVAEAFTAGHQQARGKNDHDSHDTSLGRQYGKYRVGRYWTLVLIVAGNLPRRPV